MMAPADSSSGGMERVIFLFLRRMRAPLILLILTYSISISGLVLIPGVDDAGNPWRYDFFHAFYFVSFMGPTIGFGEIPYALTPAQRMWVTFAIYLTVLSWLYAIGKIFALIQDPAFSRAITEARFIRAVRAIREPFYVVCGYGETGSLLVRSLTNRQIRCVVIDRDPENIASLHLEELALDVPSFCGDASATQHLKEAGLRLDHCIGIIAITDDDAANVKIAVTCKLLRPDLRVICRAASRAAANNMESFATDHIIDPFESFAEHMGMAIRVPSIHLLHRWLVTLPGHKLEPRLNPPQGNWVICGYGRFGQAMARHLAAVDNRISVIEADGERIKALGGQVPDDVIIGSGTDPEPLHEAGVESAVGIIAGTENDANNLSVIMTAREMCEDIFLVARQNRRADADIFKAAKVDLVMEPSRVIVWQILALVTMPLLSDFLSLARRQDDDWAHALLERLRRMTGNRSPQTWCDLLDARHAPAFMTLHAAGQEVALAALLRDPLQPRRSLPGVALLHERGQERTLLPAPETVLAPGDRILWAAREGFRERLAWLLHNPQQLEYLTTGVEQPASTIGRAILGP